MSAISEGTSLAFSEKAARSAAENFQRNRSQRKRKLKAIEAGSTAQAVEAALEYADSQDLVLVTGSLFVAAEARELVMGIQPEIYPDLLPGVRRP